MNLLEFFSRSFSLYPRGTLLLLVGLINIIWVVHVFFSQKNYRKKFYRAYAFYGFFTLLWVISNAYFQSIFLALLGKGPAIFMALVANMTSSFTGIGFCYMSALLKSPPQKVSRFTWGVLLFFATQNLILNLVPNLTVRDVIIEGNGQFELVFGPGNIVFFVMGILIIFFGFTNLAIAAFKKGRNAIQNLRFYYMLSGMSLMYGSVVIFDIILPALTQNFNFTWIPPTLSVLDILIVGYGVLTRRFHSFLFTVFKTFRVGLSTILAGLSGYAFFLLLRFSFGELGTPSIYIISLIPAIFIFIRLYAFSHSAFFSRMMGITSVENFQKTVSEFQKQNTVYTSIRELEKELQKIFCERLLIDKASLFIIDAQIKKNYPELVKYAHNHPHILVSKEILFMEENEKKHFPYSRELFQLGEICLPLYYPTNSLLGFFILGKKQHDKIYTKEEIEAIMKARSHISLNLTGILYSTELKNEVERKTAALQEKNKQMQEQNAQIVQQNNEIQHLLKEKTKMLSHQSDFLALMAHELRTPVSIAMLQSDIMIMGAEENSEWKTKAERIKNALKKLTSLLDTLFDVFQFDLNKIKISCEETAVAEFIERVYEDFKPFMKKKRIHFQLVKELRPGLTVSFDPVYIRQLMQNFLVNAIQYTPEEGSITISAYERRKYFTFTVIDNGEGVPNKTKKMIFEKFRTNHASQSPGLGLGLYIAKKIAKLHQGDVWVKDNPGGGAIFGVDIPFEGHPRDFQK